MIENYFNSRALASQNNGGPGSHYLSMDDATRALELKRKGTKIKYIAVRFNVTPKTIRKYILQAEQAELQEPTDAN